MLNDKENKKYEIIEKVANGLMTRKEASVELDLSLKQIDLDYYHIVITYV